MKRLDLYSLPNEREISIEWPTDLTESEITDALLWLEIIERKMNRSANENERQPPGPQANAGGK